MTESLSTSSPAEPRMIHPLYLLKRFWLVVAVLIGAVAYGGYWFHNAFHDRGYAPPQPIAFSHKTHAGDLKMDCNYCHFNAARGKHAGVPPMSVCLGCHGPQGGGIVGTKPGAKEQLDKLLTIAEKGSYEENGVVKEGGMVHWNRVHRLPDHVYFTHEWHVKAGVACQTCHGAIQDMTVVRQSSDLTMGWCLDCHRKANYVGGREFKHGDDTTFNVGALNNEGTVASAKPDPVVVWAQRQVKGADAPAEGHAAPATVADIESAAALDKLQKSNPAWKDLPRWRIADLPASHRAAYGGERFQNAPTQCSTCHQ